MCEINPAHTLIMRLECFTSDRAMSKAEFAAEVMDRLLKAEMSLNADGKFRFHIHEATPTGMEDWDDVDRESHADIMSNAECVCGHPYDQHRARHNNDPGECLDANDDCPCEEWSPKEVEL